MLYWGVILFVIALVAGILGFTGIAGAASFAAQVIFGIAIFLFVVALIVGRKMVN